MYARGQNSVRLVRSSDVLAVISDAELAELVRDRRLTRDAADRARGTLTWPAYGDVKLDNAGRLWIQHTRRRADEPDSWVSFDSTGVLLGRLVVPTYLGDLRTRSVLAIERNEVLVLGSDLEGAMYVSGYPLRAVKARKD